MSKPQPIEYAKASKPVRAVFDDIKPVSTMTLAYPVLVAQGFSLLNAVAASLGQAPIGEALAFPNPGVGGPLLPLIWLAMIYYGFRLFNLIEQRQQLDQAQLAQAQNLGALAQAQQLSARLESLSLDLLQLAKTNAVARQIVQDFNIQWNPGPAAAAPMPLAGPQPK